MTIKLNVRDQITPRPRIEPATTGLQIPCSPIELIGRTNHVNVRDLIWFD